jgi:putative drug exporter of the RND superfamily
MFGLGLGVAILIDVLIVRMVIAPAVVMLLGDRAWSPPAWLDRALPNISPEGRSDTVDGSRASEHLAGRPQRHRRRQRRAREHPGAGADPRQA